MGWNAERRAIRELNSEMRRLLWRPWWKGEWALLNATFPTRQSPSWDEFGPRNRQVAGVTKLTRNGREWFITVTPGYDAFVGMGLTPPLQAPMVVAWARPPFEFSDSLASLLHGDEIVHHVIKRRRDLMQLPA